jgi:hypothetical protein
MTLTGHSAPAISSLERNCLKLKRVRSLTRGALSCRETGLKVAVVGAFIGSHSGGPANVTSILNEVARSGEWLEELSADSRVVPWRVTAGNSANTGCTLRSFSRRPTEMG